ncbi:MFS transporter [Nocardia panacis]|uniref:MFS transporter n=1 Tax=Nocardia panacis TaxID=2340916 RepID=A0A3A4KT14_9NOCA|nr:MFS transporter [Nocardia panacis]RJO79275.1 MFS transporter [Nocardia panacis]
MTNTTTLAPESPPDQHRGSSAALSHRQILTILSGLLLGIFLAALDQNIVGVAIVRIANSLHGFDEQAWATTAYLITATISTPLYGKLADIYGRKPWYLLAIGVFVLGSIACTFATSMYQLAGFRAIQGLGAGGLMSLAFTIIGDLVPPRESVRYQGYFMIVFGGATVLGPVLGGFFSGLDLLWGLEGWRWVFLVNVPIGLLALLVVARVLNVPHLRQDHRVDWFGALLLSIAVVPLLIVAEQGRAWGWRSDRALLCYGVALAGLVLFLLAEYVMKDAALIPLRLFRSSTFSVAIAGGTILGVAMFGAIVLVPLYFQVVRGYSPTKSGLLMLPLVLGIMVGGQAAGMVTKYTGRYKMMPIAGCFVIAGGAALFGRVHYDSPVLHSLLYQAVIGAGLGACMQTLILAAQNAGPRSDMGVSTAAATFFRQMGGTLGVAVFLTVLFNLLPHKIIAAFGGAPPPGFAAEHLDQLQRNTAGITELPAQLKIPVLTGFTDAISAVFYVAAAVAALAGVVLLFMRELPLQGEAPAAEFGTAVAEFTQEPVALEHSLSGSIRHEDGRPVPDAALTLIDKRGRQVSRGSGDGRGRYTIDAPENGSYVLIVSAHGHQPTAISVVAGPWPQHLDLTLMGAGQVSGTVRSAASGNPLQGATVTLTDPHGEVVGAAVTTEAGVYSCHGVVSGAYTMVAVADHMRPAAATLTVSDSGLHHDITLDPMAVLAGTAWAEGRSVPDVQIMLLDGGGDLTATAHTDDAGRYLVPDLPEGEYTVVARGYPPVTSRVTVTGGRATHDIRLGYGFEQQARGQ